MAEKVFNNYVTGFLASLGKGLVHSGRLGWIYWSNFSR